MILRIEGTYTTFTVQTCHCHVHQGLTSHHVGTAALNHGDTVVVLMVVLCNIVGGVGATYHCSVLAFTTRIRWNTVKLRGVDESVALEGVGTGN